MIMLMIIFLKKNRVRLIEIPSHHLRFWWSGQNMTKNFIKSIKILFLQFVTVDQIFSKWVPFIIAIVTHTIIKWNQPSGAMANLYKWKRLHTSPTYHILVVSEWCLDLKKNGSASDDSSGIRETKMRWVNMKMDFLPSCIFLLALLLPSVCPVAEPKGFTEDPYVDDEKFREKGEFIIIIITIINVIITSS